MHARALPEVGLVALWAEVYNAALMEPGPGDERPSPVLGCPRDVFVLSAVTVAR